MPFPTKKNAAPYKKTYNKYTLLKQHSPKKDSFFLRKSKVFLSLFKGYVVLGNSIAKKNYNAFSY